MQDLTVIGVENGALIVSSDGGERYRIVIDDVLQSRLRQGIAAAQGEKKVSPREIQTHVRAGLSALEVAELTGAALEYVERFEGPVVAERQFMVDSALRVPVQSTAPADPLGEEPTTTFGDALEERLESLNALDVRWASWKDETGWIVKLTFTSREIDHDARWQFDPKRHVLAPLNNEATTLSRHGELTEGLIPRLRAVSFATDGDDARFDSGAFDTLDVTPIPDASADGAPEADASASSASSEGTRSDAPAAPGATPIPTAPAIAPAAMSVPAPMIGLPRQKEPAKHFDAYAVNRAPEESGTADHNQTADLLEALRRRRGEREAAAFEPPQEAEPAFGGPRAVSDPTDTPLEGLEPELVPGAPSSAQAGKSAPPKRQRAAMPSWDEIVFGARSDDDPA